jgi:SAM-dependent methyltransferase
MQETDRRLLQYQHFSCSRCAFEHYAMIDARDTLISTAYSQDVDYATDIVLGANHRRLIQWHHRKAISYLSASGALAGANVLDVGCHTGFFVRELRNRGVEASGIDQNETAVSFGRRAYELEGNISTASLVDLKHAGKLFKIVTAFEVLEHVEQPVLLLDQMLDVLEPHGNLIISVPNRNMCWRPPLDYPPHHLSRFSPRSIREMVCGRSMEILLHVEQMSVYELVRNFVGAKFRNREVPSLRGGAFKLHGTSLAVRRVLNAIRPLASRSLSPLDFLLHRWGVRYIGQLIVARR